MISEILKIIDTDNNSLKNTIQPTKSIDDINNGYYKDINSYANSITRKRCYLIGNIGGQYNGDRYGETRKTLFNEVNIRCGIERGIKMRDIKDSKVLHKMKNIFSEIYQREVLNGEHVR